MVNSEEIIGTTEYLTL